MIFRDAGLSLFHERVLDGLPHGPFTVKCEYHPFGHWDDWYTVTLGVH